MGFELKHIVIRLPKLDKHTAIHHAHTAAHVSYLTAAVLHGGFYGIAAGCLLVVILVGIFLHVEVA